MNAFAAGKVVSILQVTSLVQKTCGDMMKAKDPKEVFDKIAGKQEPYVSKDNPSLYAFVYDFDLNMVAHIDKAKIGENLKGKKDSKGNDFRDKILAKAKTDKKGWQEYWYKNPETGKESLKKTYFESCKAGAKDYIVLVGVYMDELKK